MDPFLFQSKAATLWTNQGYVGKIKASQNSPNISNSYHNVYSKLVTFSSQFIWIIKSSRQQHLFIFWYLLFPVTLLFSWLIRSNEKAILMAFYPELHVYSVVYMCISGLIQENWSHWLLLQDCYHEMTVKTFSVLHSTPWNFSSTSQALCSNSALKFRFKQGLSMLC